MTSKKQLKNRSGATMARKRSPNEAQIEPQDKGTPSHFEGLETLWAALEGHMLPRLPQRASKTPQDDDFLSFLDQNV